MPEYPFQHIEFASNNAPLIKVIGAGGRRFQRGQPHVPHAHPRR